MIYCSPGYIWCLLLLLGQDVCTLEPVVTERRIVCATLRQTDADHAHVVAVGIDTGPNHAAEIWTVRRVRASILAGDWFFTAAEDDGTKLVWVERFTCACGFHTIRSDPDAKESTDLARVPSCVPDDPHRSRLRLAEPGEPTRR